MPHLDRPQQLLQKTQNLIGDALEAVEATYAAELASRNSYIRDIYQHTNRFRGKRLRPVLCLLAAKACGNITREHEILAAVIEMIHTATLVHDDVLDNADVRRHVATVNVRWNNQTSVLYGDFLFTHAFHLASQTGSAEACRLIGHATNRVCEGELTQIRNRGNLSLTEAEYLDIIDGKTAELCAVACYLGAKFAGAEESEIGRLERYGRKLGQAFQIADDVLDLTGAENAVGKTLGTDLMQRKLTLPIIRLLNREGDSHRIRMIELLEAGDEKACLEISKLSRESGMIDDSLQFAHQLAEEARAEIAGIAESPARELLLQLPELSINRAC
ncbi:Octaprenyl-diphosphate synthase [Thalassoglobus neptunius]|uniref:Octaprenyl-diphosphate synthase n=1 Tax=Thalassoglobus neptunius TaxID=1938619 RepID=A0A5C5X8W4_9PLAN|nr:polyprenyl synthetase family protein [Thalassoglobus neptunius]TWT58811.1 Octaprenyl-diphosphate synthase [Thalassoglobus neptunius]